jgi:hypothetical protein
MSGREKKERVRTRNLHNDNDDTPILTQPLLCELPELNVGLDVENSGDFL